MIVEGAAARVFTHIYAIAVEAISLDKERHLEVANDLCEIVVTFTQQVVCDLHKMLPE